MFIRHPTLIGIRRRARSSPTRFAWFDVPKLGATILPFASFPLLLLIRSLSLLVASTLDNLVATRTHSGWSHVPHRAIQARTTPRSLSSSSFAGLALWLWNGGDSEPLGTRFICHVSLTRLLFAAVWRLALVAIGVLSVLESGHLSPGVDQYSS